MDKKPSFPPRMAGREYQYERAEKYLKLLEEVLQWHRNYWDFKHLNRLIEKIDTEVVKALAEELGDD